MNSNSSPILFMRAAIEEAKKAEAIGEVPIGAVVVVNNHIISSAYNEVESRQDASAHAEIIALQRASQTLGKWRLHQASIFVTLEPCTMCIGAMILARVQSLYFGAYDPRQGAVGSLYNLSEHAELPHQIKTYPGILERECGELLTSFFKKLR